MRDIIKPLVSIIVPVFNLELYIGETIDSILAQVNFSNFEVLIVDDHSTDSTLDIINQYGNSDSRIKVFTNHRRKGAAGARNAGLEMANGEWITFLDGDDIWDKSILSTQLNVLKEYPDAQLISSDFYVVDKNNKKTLQTDLDTRWKKYFDEANRTGQLLCLNEPAKIFIKDTVLTQTGIYLINAKLIKVVGVFDEDLEIFEDWLLWIKLAASVNYMIYVPKPLVTYRYRMGSLTNRGLPPDLWASIAYKRLLRINGFKQYSGIIKEKIIFHSSRNTYYHREKGQKLKAIFSAFDWVIYSRTSFEAWKNLLATFLFL